MKMTNIKEFVAYEFEDISDEELASKDFIWAPVLFPYHPGRNFYFITLSVSGGEGCFAPKERKILRDDDTSRSDDFVIDSIYDACGYNPLFLIAEAKSPSNIKSAIKGYHVYPRYMSIATPADIIKRFSINSNAFPKIEDEIKDKPNLLNELERGINEIIGKKFTKGDVKKNFENVPKWTEFVRFVPMNMDRVISIILIQPPDEKTEEEVIKEIKEDESVIDAYKVMGESRLLIKIITEDINEVFGYVESLMKRKTHTTSKIVLCTAKENGVPFEPFQTPKLKATLSDDPQKNCLQKNILRFLWKVPNVLVRDRNTQISDFRRAYQYYRKDADLEEEFEDVENQFVYKYSKKMERTRWFRTLLFVKSSLVGRQIIWDSIRDKLLGVDDTFFSRKFYAVTGDFDFIVPMDFYELHSLKRKIEEFLDTKIDDSGVEKVEKYVNDIRGYFEENPGDVSPDTLSKEEIAVIKAMMPNSMVGKDEGIIPRNEYCKWYSGGRELRELATNLESAKAVPTIELHSEKLVHAFVRFKIRDKNGFGEELERLQNDRKHIFLYREYNPVHNPGSRFFILITENFESLLEFVSSLDKYSRDTITSLIFMQEFYKPEVPQKLRCKPCRIPLNEGCDACPQYIKPIKISETNMRREVREVDLKINEIKRCKIAVVQLNLGKNVDPLTPWYNGNDKEKVITDLKERVIKFLDEAEAIKEKPDIVVFPEMCIPESIVEEIKAWIKKQKRKIIVVAGSHLHHYSDDDAHLEDDKEKKYLFSLQEEIEEFEENLNKNIIPKELKKELEKNNFSLSHNTHVTNEEGGKWVITDKEEFIVKKEDRKLKIYEKIKYYNTCPVLISDGEEVTQYDVHKNAKSPDGEIELERKYDINIVEGSGMLRFINTGFGDFCILICYDFLEGNMADALSQKIDFLIVPSWNQNHKRFKKGVLFSKGARWFTILANNGYFGESGLYAPYKREELEKLKQKTQGEGEENIKYPQFDVLELDRARDRNIWVKTVLTEEEKKIKKKFEKLDATETITPRHKELWKNGGN